MIRIILNDAGFQSDFARRIERTGNPRGMLLVCGRELGNQLKSHFRKRDQENVNRLNPGRREHFWLKVSQSVQQPKVESKTTVSVTISDPRFAQKLFGGKITPKNAEALTIPVSADAYGRTASTFTAETGLKLFIVKIGGTKTNDFENAVLAAHETGTAGFTVEYLLTKSVTQAADPEALPPISELQAAIVARADVFIQNPQAEP